MTRAITTSADNLHIAIRKIFDEYIGDDDVVTDEKLEAIMVGTGMALAEMIAAVESKEQDFKVGNFVSYLLMWLRILGERDE